MKQKKPGSRGNGSRGSARVTREKFQSNCDLGDLINNNTENITTNAAGTLQNKQVIKSNYGILKKQTKEMDQL